MNDVDCAPADHARPRHARLCRVRPRRVQHERRELHVEQHRRRHHRMPCGRQDIVRVGLRLQHLQMQRRRHARRLHDARLSVTTQRSGFTHGALARTDRCD